MPTNLPNCTSCPYHNFDRAEVIYICLQLLHITYILICKRHTKTDIHKMNVNINRHAARFISIRLAFWRRIKWRFIKRTTQNICSIVYIQYRICCAWLNLHATRIDLGRLVIVQNIAHISEYLSICGRRRIWEGVNISRVKTNWHSTIPRLGTFVAVMCWRSTIYLCIFFVPPRCESIYGCVWWWMCACFKLSNRKLLKLFSKIAKLKLNPLVRWNVLVHYIVVMTNECANSTYVLEMHWNQLTDMKVN